MGVINFLKRQHMAEEAEEVGEGRPPAVLVASPYLAARQAWDERYGDLIARAAHWRLFAFCSVGVCALLGLAVAAQAWRSQFHLYMVATDSIGRVVAAGPADRQQTLTDAMKTAAIADWVSGLRAITTDPVVQKKLIDRTYAMIAQNSRAQGYIGETFRANSPYEAIATYTRDVDTPVVMPLSGNTYRVEWIENRRDVRDGSVMDTARMVGTFTVALNPPTDEHAASVNPLGLFITDANWQRIATEERK